MGIGECDIHLVAYGEATVTLKADLLTLHTIAGQDPRDDKSECTSPLPDGDAPGFQFTAKEGRGEMQLAEPPAAANGHQAVVHIRGEGRMHFRLAWDIPAASQREDQPPGPPGFSWNNAMRFKARGKGEARVGETRVQLGAVEVDVDLGGKVLVRFATEDKRTLSFSGVINQRRKQLWRADVICDGPEWHVQGPLMLTVDQAKDRILAATLEATDGHDRMSLSWSYGKRVSHGK